MTTSRLSQKILLAFTLGLFVSVSARAASLSWDASGTSPSAPTDGAGLWSTSDVNWANSGTESGWINFSDAVIGNSGAGGTIVISTNVTANSLLLKSVASAYTISSTLGSVLTLTTGSITANSTVTINAVISGTNGLSKIGGGTLGLGGVSTYTGTTYILGGSLQNRVVNALPTATVVAIGLSGSNASATLDVRNNLTVAGIVAVGSDPTKNLISNTQTTAGTTLTINPDGAGGAAADSTFSGIIKNGDATHILSLTKAGSHTLTLTGTNTYTGTTTVTAGTLIINGAISGSSAVTVGSAGRLGGTGSLGSISVSGTIGAGDGGIGTLSTNDLTFNSTGALENEFGRTGLTPASDLLSVTGSISLASGANLLLALSGSNPVNGDIFFLVNNDLSDSITGVFTKLNGTNTTLNQGSIFSFNSQSFQISYAADLGTSSLSGGNDIAIQVVPEPAVCALIGLSAMALLWRRRRAP
ncbi:hypothetical protein BH09VER1_BH09VER1_39780 [soil metagenome]